MVVQMNGSELLVGFSVEQSGSFGWELGRRVKRSSALYHEPLDALSFFTVVLVLRRGEDQSSR